MFKLWSIRNLLNFWSVATVVAILTIASVAIYTNGLFSDTQRYMTEQVLPMENASRQISGIASAFVTRQKRVVTSSSIDEIEQLISRQQLENKFNQHWRQIALSVLDNEQGKKIVSSLQEYYQRFLDVDSELLELIETKHALQTVMQQRINKLDVIESEIQDHVEGITGRINLQVSRDRRAIRLAQQDVNFSFAKIQMGNSALNEQAEIQKLSQSVRLNALTISSLTQRIIQSKSIDTLLSIRENSIRQYESALKSDIKQLSLKLGQKIELLQLTQHLDWDVQRLMQVVLDSESSIYRLRLQQLQNNQLLVLGQQNSTMILKDMTAKLDDLSNLVSDQNRKTVEQSTRVANNARWFILLVGVLITLGIARVVRSISNRINTPLAELRGAMHALSSKKFDTRLEVVEGKSEFALLAEDFNSFATNNERLIDDLADAKDSIEIREQHISAILNGVPEAILTLTDDGIIQSANPTAEQILKVTDGTLMGLSIFRFFDEAQNINNLEEVLSRLEQGQEFVGRDYNNQLFAIWLSLNSIPSSNMDAVWVCVISDITAWKKAEEKLKTTSIELDTILENAMVGIAFIKNRKLHHVNSKFEDLFICEREKIEGQSAECLYPTTEAFEQLGEQAYSVLTQGENFEGQAQLIRQNGELFWCAISSKAIDPDDPHDGTIWLFEDVTKERESDEQLRKLANVDSLTNLPNRSVFHDRLEHALHKSHRNANSLAVFFLDLDHFKHINDSLGHAAGDVLLCDVANRLTGCVREDDTVARLGGDEFTIILEDIHSVKYAAKVADKIFDAMSKPFILEGTEVNVSPSIGISLYPADGRDVDILLRNADAAMYHAKEHGRNNFQFYSSEMNAQAAQRLAMETSLRRAVEQNEFYLHFQPQIDLRKGKIVGAEALLRWNNETWGRVSPAEFVPILEDTGLIGVVGELVIQQACEAYMALRDKLDPDFTMSVNLSGRQFKGGQLASFIKGVLDETGMPARNLELEITESILMDDADLAIETLQELSALDITMAIDDFGTGYSSLSYLKRFPLDVLKIDRSFVQDVTIDADDAAIVDAILAMSRRLGLDVVAEGVETAEQLAFLKEHNCRRVQGYYFSKPLEFSAFSDFIQQDVKYA
ncbi:MAG: EAL domain-containing protein [Piscirickettsiaceae bacterium]|nr:EAL domain-containing protein [Piscirickettsiaceae bacterium]